MLKKISPVFRLILVLFAILVLAGLFWLIFIYRPVDSDIKTDIQSETQAEVISPSLLNTQAQSYASENIPVWQEGDLIFGSPEAALKIFVFEDYASLFSAKLADDLEKLRLEFGPEIAIIVRPYLNDFKSSASSAAAVSCAAEQGKWKEMRALLFTRLKTQQFSDLDFSDYGRQLGLEVNAFDSCLTNVLKSETIEQMASSPATYQVYGAPTIFIGSEIIPGARPYDDYVNSLGEEVAGLKTIVAGALEK